MASLPLRKSPLPKVALKFDRANEAIRCIKGRMRYTPTVMQSDSVLREQPVTYGTEPVPQEVLDMAQAAVKNFHECFWWWHQDAKVTTREDVRAVIESLRESGGHKAWAVAQELHKCL